MKHVLCLCAVAALLLGCTAKSGKFQRPEELKFTAVQGYGLVGDVRSVEYEDYTINFDTIGNLTSVVWKDGGSNMYEYESPTRYKINGIGPFQISCEDNLRREEDEQGIELPFEYEFDNQGRVIRYAYQEYMSRVTEVYTYEGKENGPVTMSKEYGYETGMEKQENVYTYREWDEQGNWIQRDVERKITSTLYNEGGEGENKTVVETEHLTEKRIISYY